MTAVAYRCLVHLNAPNRTFSIMLRHCLAELSWPIATRFWGMISAILFRIQSRLLFWVLP